MKLGKNIQYVGTLLDMQRKEVADKLGISHQQYSKIETNKVNIDENRLNELSRIFKVPASTIKELDTDKLYHQINQDQSTVYNNNGTMNNHHSDKLVELLENQTKIISTLVSVVEELKNKITA